MTYDLNEMHDNNMIQRYKEQVIVFIFENAWSKASGSNSGKKNLQGGPCISIYLSLPNFNDGQLIIL